MVIHEKTGNLRATPTQKQVDRVLLEWFELNKRIWHKKTTEAVEISFKCLNSSPRLQEDDILFEDESSVIVVDIIPAEAILIYPSDPYELATVCYEIGNKHLPLFFEDDILMTPFDLPLLRQLSVNGYTVKEELRKLSAPLHTSVIPHGLNLFSRAGL